MKYKFIQSINLATETRVRYCLIYNSKMRIELGIRSTHSSWNRLNWKQNNYTLLKMKVTFVEPTLCSSRATICHQWHSVVHPGPMNFDQQSITNPVTYHLYLSKILKHWDIFIKSRRQINLKNSCNLIHLKIHNSVDYFMAAKYKLDYTEI